MAKRVNYRSKTQWITQPRDGNGRWARIGGVFKGASKGVAKIGKSIARANGVDLGYTLNPWKASAGAGGEYTRELGGGFSSTTTVSTRIHRTDNKSPFARAIRRGADQSLSKIDNRRAQGIARAVTGIQPQRIQQSSASSIRFGKGGSIRSKSKKAKAAELVRAQKKVQRRLKKRAAVERARSAGNGRPNTLSKGISSSTYRSAGNIASAGRSTKSHKHLVVPYKAKRKRN